MRQAQGGEHEILVDFLDGKVRGLSPSALPGKRSDMEEIDMSAGYIRAEGQYWTDPYNPVCCSVPADPTECLHCYAETTSNRFNLDFRHRGFSEKRAVAPMRARKPRIYFTSMGDLLDPSLTEREVHRVLTVIDACPEHVFLVCTKRTNRIGVFGPWLKRGTPNLWLAASASDQESAERRWRELCAAWSGYRWIILEPLLGPVDMDKVIAAAGGQEPEWVVVGRETGKDPRELEPGNSLYNVSYCFDMIVAWCEKHGIPVWIKSAPADVERARQMPDPLAAIWKVRGRP